MIGLSARSAVLGSLLSVAAAGYLAAQKVELPKCQKPDGDAKVTSFTVPLPLPMDRAHSRVVRAFTEVGITPSEAGKVSNAIEWDSGTNDSGMGVRRRMVRATVFEDDDGGAKVVVAPIEYGFQWGEETTKPLSQKNAGYGFKVWCAAKAVADSLTVAADRIRARQTASGTDASVPAVIDTASVPAQ